MIIKATHVFVYFLDLNRKMRKQICYETLIDVKQKDKHSTKNLNKYVGSSRYNRSMHRS